MVSFYLHCFKNIFLVALFDIKKAINEKTESLLKVISNITAINKQQATEICDLKLEHKSYSEQMSLEKDNLTIKVKESNKKVKEIEIKNEKYKRQYRILQLKQNETSHKTIMNLEKQVQLYKREVMKLRKQQILEQSSNNETFKENKENFELNSNSQDNYLRQKVSKYKKSNRQLQIDNAVERDRRIAWHDKHIELEKKYHKLQLETGNLLNVNYVE